MEGKSYEDKRFYQNVREFRWRKRNPLLEQTCI